MRRSLTALACVGVALLSVRSSADVQVSRPDFVVEQVAAVNGDGIPKLEAVRNPAYGEGVVAGAVDQGFLVLTRHSGTESSDLVRVGPFNEGAELVTIRFDTTGQFGNQLLVSLVHDGGSGGGNAVTDILAIDAAGRARRLESIGSADNPVTLNLAVSDGSWGYRAGLYLQDRNLMHGSPLYFLDRSLELSIIDKNLLPDGRTDIDVQDMLFDPTGLYSSQLILSDCDDHDQLSGLYVLGQRLRWRELVRLEPTSEVAFGQLAFSAGGAFDLSLYVVERIGRRVVKVSPTGGLEDFATGFDAPESITVGADGKEMYVSDRGAIYRIRAE